jgi:NADPH:quinone reductase-like Zn-dependent oxidoreductase
VDPSGNIRAVFFLVSVSSERLGKLTELFDRRKLIAHVGTILPLQQARLAHEMLDGVPHKRGKIILSVAELELDHSQAGQEREAQ